MRYQAVFERHEKKFLLDRSQVHALTGDLAPYMERDGYGLHTICSLYFDTGDFSIIRHSLSKPDYKEKLRLRSYGVPKEEDRVFLELKKKCDGVTYKRRISMTLREAWAYLNGGELPAEGRQIFREIDWFIGRHDPEPKVLLCYDRIALHGREDRDIRVTFDFDVRWRDSNLCPSKGDYGTALMERDRCIAEVKLNRSMPVWLSKILSKQALFPASYSKYGTVYKNMLRYKGGVSLAG